jgi:antitoxin CcdA
MRMSNPHKMPRNSSVRDEPRPQKQAVNLSISSDLLNQARDAEFNLSSILEMALQQRLQQLAAERWLVENRAGIEAYNEQVEEHGVFSNGLRTF